MITRYHTSSPKQIAATLIVMSLLSVVFFSFATTMHRPDERMQSGCPFTAMGTLLCPQDLVAATIHHISAYQSLLNVRVGTSMTVLFIALLMLVCGVLIFFIRPPAFQPQLIRYLHYSSHPSPRDRENTRWLSLFEHSPSLV